VARADILTAGPSSSRAARAQFWHEARACAAIAAPRRDRRPYVPVLIRPHQGLFRRFAALTFILTLAAVFRCFGRPGRGDELLLPVRELVWEVAGR
jgi:hypothetical protein